MSPKKKSLVKKTNTVKKNAKKTIFKSAKKPVKKIVKKTVNTKSNKPVKKKVESQNLSVRVVSNRTPELLRGFKDVLPKDSFYWRKIMSLADNIGQSYGFAYTSTPIVEEASLFIRSIGFRQPVAQ
jgi:UDP-glucose 6-dehydrogenase